RGGRVPEGPRSRAEPALRAGAHEPARGAVAGLDLRDRHAHRPASRPPSPPALLVEPLHPWPDGRAPARVPLMAIPARPLDPSKDRDRRLAESRDAYHEHAYQFRDRRLGESPSAWARSFGCDDMKVLI